jgi:hypothetical protein
VFLQNPEEADHLASSRLRKEESLIMENQIQEEEEPDEEADKQKNEEGELKDVKPEN